MQWVKVTQLCLTLCNPMNCTVHGILQARILEWVDFPFSRGSFQPRNQPRNQTRVSCTAGRFFTNWAIREAHAVNSSYDSYILLYFVICIHLSYGFNSKLHIKKQRHYFANKGPSSQAYGFSSGPLWMWELDCEESWATKNWCFWTVVLEKTPESPLDCKETQPVHPEGDKSWVFIGGTDVEAETPILWPPHSKSWLIGEDPDAGRDWGQEEKGMTEVELAGWHNWLDGHEFE